MKKNLLTVLSGIMAGLSIGLACIAFLAIENPLFGAIFFSLGLFLVLVNGFGLFTGMVCYAFENKLKYVLTLVLILAGNAIGSIVIGSLMRLTRFTEICVKSEAILTAKLSGSLLSTFVLGMLCNALIFFAVDCYRNCRHSVGKYLGILMLVPAFIICGYEHSVADMCYIGAANLYTFDSLIFIVVVVLGNTVGGLLSALGTKGVSLLRSIPESEIKQKQRNLRNFEKGETV